MSESDPAIAEFWHDVRGVLGDNAPAEEPEAWAFGDSPEMADDLLGLVLERRKTATSAALWEIEGNDEPLPKPGDLSIILDGRGRPRCVIETTEVRIAPMSDVDEQFAYDEGEDDRTLQSWYAAHERFFRRNLPQVGRAFDPSMPLVLERFEVRYSP